MLAHFDPKVSDEILKEEDTLDRYEDKLGSFLVKLSSRSMSDRDSRQVSLMLHSIGDFERLGDHAVNLLKTAQEIHDKEITFSDEAREEIQNMTDALIEILDITVRAFTGNDRAASPNEAYRQERPHPANRNPNTQPRNRFVRRSS